MLGYSYKYIVSVANEYASDDDEYEKEYGFNDLDDALRFMDSIDGDQGISISLYEHKLGIWY